MTLNAWEITYDYLKQVGLKPNKRFIENEISTHPDYPALSSIKDFLDSGGNAFEAYETDETYINDFQFPLMAHIKMPGNEYLEIINSKSDWLNKKNTLLKDWSGIIIMPDSNNINWKNTDNERLEQREKQNKITYGILLGIFTGIYIFSILLNKNLLFSSFGFLSYLGIFCSLLLLSTELGIESKIAKQVCGTISKGGCDAVIKSKYAPKIFGLSPTDLSLTFFSIQFLIYLIASFFSPSLTQLAYLITLLAIPIPVWSIYTQAIKIKQWCPLCLSIVAIILLQLVISFVYFSTTPLIFSYPFWVYMLPPITSITFVFLSIPVKKLLLNYKIQEKKLIEFSKWKKDVNLFNTQLANEVSVNTDLWEHDLHLGKQNAPVHITVACNPYCKPCATAHKQIDELLAKYPNLLQVSIRFLNQPEQPESAITQAVSAIIAASLNITDKHELQEMLADWFNLMNYDTWLIKWGEKVKNDNEDKIKRILLKHYNWVNEAEIQFTPTIFVNGKKMPGRYQLSDFEKIIPNL